MPELLLPAGNLKKLNTAFHFGADAVYFGGKDLSLRAGADNFSKDEIAAGVKRAHELGKKAYFAANIYAKDDDLQTAKQVFSFLADVKADGVLVSDMGLLRLARSFPTPIHISTQANTQNSEAVKFFWELGVSRVVLARELSLFDIRRIHEESPEMELEAFVHGAMCMSMSGRCFLSSYFTSRSANRGECSQPCRWGYRLTEVSKNSHMPLDAEEDERGSYLLNSKDLKLISRLKDLEDAGVCSFKVEGRMKSEFYVATVALAYRTAIDEIEKYGEIKSLDNLNRALDEVSHRPYTEAFFDGQNLDTFSPDVTKIDESAVFIANVLAFSDCVATVEMRNRFRAGDTLTILTPSENNGKSFVVHGITLNGEPTDDAKLVQSVYSFPCPYDLFKGDLLLKK